MKKIVALGIVTLLLLSTFTKAQINTKVWPELKAFHTLMAATFHPSEEGNLTPLKSKSDSLLMAAKQWQSSLIPNDFKPEETKSALKKLVKQCVQIKKAVKKSASDDELKQMITSAHNTFHIIAGECRKPEK